MTDHVPRIRRANIDDAPAISSCVMAAYAPYVIRIGKPPAPALEDYSQVVSRHDVFVLTVEEKIAGVQFLSSRSETSCSTTLPYILIIRAGDSAED